MSEFKGKFVTRDDSSLYVCPIMSSDDCFMMCRGGGCMLWIDCTDLKGDKVGCGSCGLLGTEQVIPNIAKKAQG